MKLSNLKRPLLQPSSALEEPESPAAWSRVDRLPEQTLQGQEVIAVTMTCLDRHRVRRKLTTSDGQGFALALPTGMVLQAGMVLSKNSTTAYVVEAAPEAVLVIHPESHVEALRIAYAIGNLHRDVQVDGDTLVVLAEGSMELQLQRLKVAFLREVRPFLGKPAWEH
ncbi:urease accessory protein UreE [Deinococcus roseus]|uniref:Urease accessory protein UreE n=1 Tax=Deinococcus roseus TaxID=392414 RepID=A0ABQ2DHY5_9DEIO|nr:urease accessory protein UreE [Deinococcus roseus]GGJ58363.1 urease accessory protein UreE [Deinococcus roseus]